VAGVDGPLVGHPRPVGIALLPQQHPEIDQCPRCLLWVAGVAWSLLTMAPADYVGARGSADRYIVKDHVKPKRLITIEGVAVSDGWTC